MVGEANGGGANARPGIQPLPIVEAGLVKAEGEEKKDVPTPKKQPELSEKTIALLEEAAPKIKTKVVEVTEEMYQSLFEAHPELRCQFSLEFYNRPSEDEKAKPGKSLSAQAVILAETIVAVLGSLRQLDALEGNIDRIAGKHVSRDVLPAHYDALAEFFLGGVQMVLTKYGLYSSELMAAFEEAYEFLAFVFSSREAKLRETIISCGGWSGYRKFLVTDLETAKRSVVYRMRPLDGKPVVNFNAGSFISVQVDVPGHGIVTRSFAQSPLAKSPDDFVIEVKYDQLYNEYPLSNHLLIDAISHGTIVDVSCPQGGLVKNKKGPGGRDSQLNSARKAAGASPMASASPLAAAGGSTGSPLGTCPFNPRTPVSRKTPRGRGTARGTDSPSIVRGSAVATKPTSPQVKGSANATKPTSPQVKASSANGTPKPSSPKLNGMAQVRSPAAQLLSPRAHRLGSPKSQLLNAEHDNDNETESDASADAPVLSKGHSKQAMPSLKALQIDSHGQLVSKASTLQAPKPGGGSLSSSVKVTSLLKKPAN
mmetsp:Transcript_6659/g.14221  ORF Transcript_6659/g.14221 Transcript_6659/m.14221 type:complete len:539 (+) Transcript_6659:164-1780(+)